MTSTPLGPAQNRATLQDGASTPKEPPLHDARLMSDKNGIARITLDGKVYTLRITRAGKLILTK